MVQRVCDLLIPKNNVYAFRVGIVISQFCSKYHLCTVYYFQVYSFALYCRTTKVKCPVDRIYLNVSAKSFLSLIFRLWLGLT